MKFVFLILGFLFTAIGIVGIVTPILPTTPFLLLAAGCFARSSDKFHHWLMTHPKLSPPIHDWQRNGVIRRPAKLLATLLILVNVSFPVLIIKSISMGVRVTVAVIACCVLTFIWTRPSLPPPESQ